MMNENDAHSGANPETDDKIPTDTVIADAFDEDDDDPGFEVIYDSTPGGPDAPEPEPAPPESLAIAPPEPVEPVGTAAILEAQLGEALKIMRDFSSWIHHPGSGIGDCVHVSHAVSELVTSSAALAKIATRLQHGQSETRHRIIVERDFSSAGGGVARSRKRINHGGV